MAPTEQDLTALAKEWVADRGPSHVKAKPLAQGYLFQKDRAEKAEADRDALKEQLQKAAERLALLMTDDVI